MTGTALRGFATINFWAEDVAAARDWYADFLGTQAYFEGTDAAGRLVYAEFRVGDSERRVRHYRSAPDRSARWVSRSSRRQLDDSRPDRSPPGTEVLSSPRCHRVTGRSPIRTLCGVNVIPVRVRLSMREG